MATRTIVTLVDDLDGGGADQSVSFGLDGADWRRLPSSLVLHCCAIRPRRHGRGRALGGMAGFATDPGSRVCCVGRFADAASTSPCDPTTRVCREKGLTGASTLKERLVWDRHPARTDAET
ncbi:Lsr2 dimerization domain-containing protein [Actinomycetospora endophytica]|uniref:Lsr2 dimerization domain-containing protein n=1 Tax=Actinomycetospora endophytica TaxID=2291215 RepID=UPI003FD6C17F